MFAAAAVAAAAALTVISTTSTSTKRVNELGGDGSHTGSGSSSNDKAKNQHRHISWAQYAHQRRNSLQRRKIEITKKLEKASNINKQGFKYQSSTSLSRRDGGGDAALRMKLNEVNLLKMTSNKSITIDLDALHCLDLDEICENEALIKELSTNVCAEFLKLYKMSAENGGGGGGGEDENDMRPPELDFHNLSYSNFNLINNLTKAADSQTQFDMNLITQSILEFIQAEKTANGQTTTTTTTNNANNANTTYANNAQSRDARPDRFAAAGARNKKQKTSQMNVSIHKWDPKWLKKLRKMGCIPLSLVCLVLLVFTNTESHWIRFQDNERAGLWSRCNRTILYKLDKMLDVAGTASASAATVAGSQSQLSMVSNNNNNNNTTNHNNVNTTSKRSNPTANERAKRNKNATLDLMQSAGINMAPSVMYSQVESCYSKFFLKEDGQLILLVISAVAIVFHLIGTIFLFTGLMCVSSNSTLYYFHSAGECLISSAILIILNLVAFIVLVSSQVEKPHAYGYCFYTSWVISFLTMFCALVLYLDEMVSVYLKHQV